MLIALDVSAHSSYNDSIAWKSNGLVLTSLPEVFPAQVRPAIVVTFVGTLVAVPSPNVDNNDCQHQDLFDSTLRGGESPAHMYWRQSP